MNIAVLLHGPVHHDARVIKTIRVLEQFAQLSLFYVNGRGEDQALFSGDTSLYSIAVDHSRFSQKLKGHTQFYKQYLLLKEAVLNSGKQFDVIWSNDLPTLLPGLQLKKHFNAKLVYDSHEIYIETLNQFFPATAKGIKGMVTERLLAYMQKSGLEFEKHAVKEVDYFITVNRSLADYFEAAYGVPEVHVIMNCPDQSNREIVSKDIRAQYKWSKEDSIYIYQGMLNQGRSLKTLIKAFAKTETSLKLLLLGDGVLKPELQQLVKSLGAANKIAFHDRVAYNELPQWTAGADFGISLIEPINLSKKMASPNKLFEYMHAGIPVLTTQTPEAEKVFNQFEIGLLTDNSEKDLIQKLELLPGHKLLAHFSAQSQLASGQYNWQKQSNLLHSILESQTAVV